ncbi:EAL domain-containing protein [Peribacillus alkalitolerans]|uniref:EAL domain-containing protein n=1 Tax=Peribacillus alkalitolerans TaxID=1550385 RepID=UPI0013D25597|nr:EAL domain-containing protein [Peribacillus alkalitolerans]
MTSINHFKRNSWINWMKIFLPQKKLRYYPPQFIIRNPIVSSVKDAFSSGYEVAVIVFNIQNLKELIEKIGNSGIRNYTYHLKNEFLQAIKLIINEDDILILHDYQSEGLTLMLKIDPQKQRLDEIDSKSQKVIEILEASMKRPCPQVTAVFNTGYMFIEKRYYSIEESISIAHEQAVAMAEKKIQTQFNHMLYTMSQIINSKDIRLLAQPIFNVATREIKAYEVLTRGPANTDLENPLRLFAVARQTGMLYELELIVLEKTLQQIMLNGSEQNVFINFTPVTVGHAHFVKDFKRALNQYPDVHPSQIVIEITERDSIEGIHLLMGNIKQLRAIGLRFAVDDTGAGYASLHTINEIMPDIIKIDRSVINNIDNNSVKESMLKGLLLIAKETGSLVVAEGIESEKEAMVLSKNNVDLAQGYFYARPAKIDEKVKISS